MLTTRYSIPDLQAFWDSSAPEHKLLRLSKAAGVALLRKLKVHGAQAECEKLVESVKGHALSVHLFGSFLRDAHGGDVRQRDRVRLAQANAQEHGGHAFRVMDAYVNWLAQDGAQGRQALGLLSLLGLFDRPADAGCLGALLQAPTIAGLTDDLIDLDEAQRNLLLTRLQDAGLLTVHKAAGQMRALDAHPLLREYFAERLERDQRKAFAAAHGRLYTYLCDNTEDKAEPSLDDLQPLYQAVAHGCLAGMPQRACDEVYVARIQRKAEHYSTQKLGAFGTDLCAVSCFFVQQWQRLAAGMGENAQAWLLTQAAYRLRALGRLNEAGEPMRTGLAMVVKKENWKQAAKSANNLAELTQTLGDLAGAVQYAQEAVNHADRSRDAFQRLARRATHADALHQAGQPLAAKALFCQAEVMEAKNWSAHLLLDSLPGFRYCELLLAAPEAAAWQRSVQSCIAHTPLLAGQGGAPVLTDAVVPMQIFQQVNQTAGQTLVWWTTQFTASSLLDIALKHLTLGRAALFSTILAGQLLAQCQASLGLAVDSLRRAGMADQLPHGLLTHAWLLAHTSHHTGPDSAQTDLDEAWEIAERGPMPLFMADIHLYRAGLFHHLPQYPAAWQSAVHDAQAARSLIEKHGYLRRMGQLEAVEAAISSKMLK